MKDSTIALIRHTLTFIGGTLVTRGLLDEQSLQELVGALITLTSVCWMLIDKLKKNNREMSQLFNFSFQNLQNIADSPGAINKNQVVYAYTQNAKTLLVLTNGDSRIASNALADVKSTFGLTSIGTPTRANGQVISLGEVLVNNDYVTQVFDDTASRRVQMNQPASAPVVFTTTATLTGIVANSFAGERGYKEWIGYIDVNGTNAATGTTLYNTMGVAPTVTTVTGGTINTSPSIVYWKLDFTGVITSGNIATSTVLNITAGNQPISNSTTMPRASLGTAEEASSIVIATWSSSTVNTGVINKFLVSLKFFG